MDIDKASNIVIGIAKHNQDAVRFRETNAVCPKCNDELEYYYCEDRTYAVRCRRCQMVTLVKAGSPIEAAGKVGIVAQPMEDCCEDDGVVLCYRFPIRDECDVCIADPYFRPEDVPDGFTHFINLSCPNNPKRRNDDAL